MDGEITQKSIRQERLLRQLPLQCPHYHTVQVAQLTLQSISLGHSLQVQAWEDQV